MRPLHWDNIRRTAGLIFLAYLVFINPQGIPIWVGALIAGCLGIPDVFFAQTRINNRVQR